MTGSISVTTNMPEELKACLCQLPYSNTGFVMCHFMGFKNPLVILLVLLKVSRNKVTGIDFFPFTGFLFQILLPRKVSS